MKIWTNNHSFTMEKCIYVQASVHKRDESKHNCFLKPSITFCGHNTLRKRNMLETMRTKLQHFFQPSKKVEKRYAKVNLKLD